MNIITRASVKERIHVEQIIRSQPHMHNSGLVDIVTIPVRKCLGLSMDVYKPVGEVKEPLPIILDIHGGGLIAGRKEQNRNLGIQLARRGYIVFIPDYRLVPETDIFGQISDILDALAVIEAKAAEFGGNIEKLFVTADSAGAFLASMAVASLHHPTEISTFAKPEDTQQFVCKHPNLIKRVEKGTNMFDVFVFPINYITSIRAGEKTLWTNPAT